MSIAAFDHAAIPIADVQGMLGFYERLGFTVREVQPELFYSAYFGANKINFHAPKAWQSLKFTLRGPTARPGCGDFCFVWAGTSSELTAKLADLGYKPIWYKQFSEDTVFAYLEREGDPLLIEFLQMPRGYPTDEESA